MKLKRYSRTTEIMLDELQELKEKARKWDYFCQHNRCDLCSRKSDNLEIMSICEFCENQYKT
ncbi:MAG: hypothetical protein FK731_15650 [Asgard group archaeon]|nr:hypothetical protein [Asgard group archaeon]